MHPHPIWKLEACHTELCVFRFVFFALLELLQVLRLGSHLDLQSKFGFTYSTLMFDTFGWKL